MNTPGMVRTAPSSESVEATDDRTVRFALENPSTRFHSLFPVRWNGAWIMPKHVLEQVVDVTAHAFPPVSLGPCTLNSFDPNGYRHVWEKRADWDRTAMAEWGEPGPQYVVHRSIPSR